MKGFWASQCERISEWGLLRTLGYYVFAVGADKVGIGIWDAFEYPGQANSIPQSAAATFLILQSMEDWTARDLELLVAHQGKSRLELYRGYFDLGNKCAVARWGGTELACLLWLKTTSGYCQNPGQNCVVLTDAVTLPDHRGKGLYPQTLSFICDYALGVWGDSVKIYADCSVVNYASKKGLLKSGFVPSGWIVSVFDHTWYWTNRRSSRLNRINVGCAR